MNTPDHAGATPLQLAAFENHHHMVGELIALGADLGTQDKFGATPLHLATAAGNLEMMAELVEGGADINARDKAGHTPLYVAAYRQQADAVKYLLGAGADNVIIHEDEGRRKSTIENELSSLRHQAGIPEIIELFRPDRKKMWKQLYEEGDLFRYEGDEDENSKHAEL